MNLGKILFATVSSGLILINSAMGAAISAVGATASSSYSSGFLPTNAIDSNNGSRWSSIVGPSSDPSWIMIDLGGLYSLETVTIDWERASRDYTLRISSDLSAPSPTTNLAAWTTIATVTGQNEPNQGSGTPDETFNFINGTFTDNSGTGVTSADVTSGAPSARYLLLYGTSRSSIYGHSIYEIKSTGSAVPEPTTTVLVVLATAWATTRRRNRTNDTTSTLC